MIHRVIQAEIEDHRKFDELLNDRADFRAYLEALPPHAIAGMVRDQCQCPLATWVEARGYNADFSEDQASYDDGFYDLPIWARTFIRKVDATHPKIWVTVEEALQVLREVEVEVDRKP